MDDLVEGKVLGGSVIALRYAVEVAYRELLDDAICTLDRLLLEREHRLRALQRVSHGIRPSNMVSLYVERLQGGAVLVECVIVEVNELF